MGQTADSGAQLSIVYRPDDYRALLERVLNECNTGFILDHLECDELPCLAWGRIKPGLGVTDLDVRFAVCRPWRDVFEEEVVFSQRNDPQQHAGLIPHESRAPLDWDTNERVRERFDERGHFPGVALEGVLELPGPEFFERLYRDAIQRRDREARQRGADSPDSPIGSGASSPRAD